MTHIWTFSEESKQLLQRCLDSAPPVDKSNKWVKQFGVRNENINKETEVTVILEDSPKIDELPEDKKAEDTKVAEEFTDPDFDIISKFNNLEDKSAAKSNIKELASNLPINTLEKLNHYVFNNEMKNSKFLKHYFKYILPIYMTRDNSRLSSDLLLKTFRFYSDYFFILIKVVFKDMKIENNVIHDFILSLNDIEQADFLNSMINLELTQQEFSYNLFNIYTAYKSCNKNESTQKNIFCLLKTFSQFCTTDKNYGKLLLAYLQHEKSLNKEVNKSDIERILEMHNSAFKRPCAAIFKEINNV